MPSGGSTPPAARPGPASSPAPAAAAGPEPTPRPSCPRDTPNTFQMIDRVPEPVIGTITRQKSRVELQWREHVQLRQQGLLDLGRLRSPELPRGPAFMPAASCDHPIETPLRRPPLKIGTTTATEVACWASDAARPSSGMRRDAGRPGLHPQRRAVRSRYSRHPSGRGSQSASVSVSVSMGRATVSTVTKVLADLRAGVSASSGVTVYQTAMSPLPAVSMDGHGTSNPAS